MGFPMRAKHIVGLHVTQINIHDKINFLNCSEDLLIVSITFHSLVVRRKMVLKEYYADEDGNPIQKYLYEEVEEGPAEENSIPLQGENCFLLGRVSIV